MSIDVTGTLRNSYLAILLTIFGGERDERKGMSDDRAPDRNPTGVAGGAARAARCREGAHAAGRRARPPAPAAALGIGREGVRLRDRRREEDPGPTLRQPLSAARVPLHVRLRASRRRAEPGVHGLLPRLRSLRRRDPAPQWSRRDAGG